MTALTQRTYRATWDYCHTCGYWEQIVWGKCGTCWRAEDPVIVRRTFAQDFARDWNLRIQPWCDRQWVAISDVRAYPVPLALLVIVVLTAKAMGVQL